MAVSFKMSKEKLDKRMEKMLEEKQPVLVERKPGQERINTSLRSVQTLTMTIDLERFNKQKLVAEEFMKLSGSILDTVMLLSSWVSHNRINLAEKDAIIDYLNRK